MKLNIYTAGAYSVRKQQWWLNYRQSLDKNAVPGVVLENTYNGKLVIITDNWSPYIEFNDPEDATVFLLTFS